MKFTKLLKEIKDNTLKILFASQTKWKRIVFGISPDNSTFVNYFSFGYSLTIYIFMIIYIVGCASAPPDVPVFERLTSRTVTDPVTNHVMLKASPTCWKEIKEFECGHGVHIVSGKEFYVGNLPENYYNGKSWDQIQLESILMPAVESYAPLSAHIINSCIQLKCDKEVTKFKVKVDVLENFTKAVPDKAKHTIDLK